MQPNTRRLFPLFAGFAILSLTQCKKSSNDNNGGGTACQLVSVVASGGGTTRTYTIGYDAQSRPDSIRSVETGGKSYTAYFAYGDKKTIVTNLFDGIAKPATIDTVFFDEQHNVISISILGGNGDYSVLSYPRNAQNELTSSTTLYNGSVQTYSTYVYSNSDIVSGNSAGDNFTYTYYIDKPSSIFDYLAIAQWLNYGAVVYKDRHLVKSFQTDHISQSFTYKYDEQGHITDAIATTGTETGSYHYVYQCH